MLHQLVANARLMYNFEPPHWLVSSVRSSNLGEFAYCAASFVTQWGKTRDSENISFCPLGPTEYIHSHREFGQPSLWSTGEATNNLEVPTIAMDKSSKWTYFTRLHLPHDPRQNQLWATNESWLAYPSILYGGCIPKVSRANSKSDQMKDIITFNIWNKVWPQESESKSNIGTLWTSQQKCIPWSSDDITLVKQAPTSCSPNFGDFAHKEMISNLWTFQELVRNLYCRNWASPNGRRVTSEMIYHWDLKSPLPVQCEFKKLIANRLRHVKIYIFILYNMFMYVVTAHNSIDSYIFDKSLVMFSNRCHQKNFWLWYPTIAHLHL